MQPFDYAKHDLVFSDNPLGMTTADIAYATTYIEDHIDWLEDRKYTSHQITNCRARLAALRAELIRRTN